MFVDIVNGVISMAILAGVIYGGRWLYLAGWKDGRSTLRAEIRLEALEASNAKLQLDEEARKLAEAL